MNQKNLKIFEQHGFSETSETDTQSIGNCIFCGGTKFYINIKTRQWDCKSGSCGKSGGYKTFLTEVVNLCRDHFRNKPALRLSIDRKINVSDLRHFKIGFNPLNNSYIIPVYNADNELQDVRIYKHKKLLSSAGCKVGLFNMQHIDHCVGKIWLCEGEWDCLAIQKYLSDEDIAVSVPGANTFKDEWISLFAGKSIIAAYDKDKAGEDGAVKCYEKLKTIVHEIQFIKWEKERPNKFDLRDFIIENTNESIIKLKKLLQPTPLKTLKDAKVKLVDVLDGEGLAPEKVYKAFQKWFYLPDVMCLDVMFGTIIANRLDDDPVWLFIVAPPGGSKTALLTAIMKAPNITTTTTLTSHSLVSGSSWGSGDPSLIPKLDGKVLIIKDFTTILSMNVLARDEIFGILRDAYDGKTEKHFGNGIFRSYESRFGIIGGVTPVIEQFTEEHAAVGERFLRFNIPLTTSIEQRKDYLRKAMFNINSNNDMYEELQKISNKALQHKFTIIPKMSKKVSEQIINLAQFISIMRSGVSRDKYSKEITGKPFTELGTRPVKQLSKLITGIAQFRHQKEITNRELACIKQVARSTVPKIYNDLLKIMYHDNIEYDDQILADMIGLPSVTVRRKIENLGMLNVLSKKKLSRIKYIWFINNDFLKILKGSGVYDD